MSERKPGWHRRFLHLRQVVKDGSIGDVLSSSVVAVGEGWAAAIENVQTGAYLLDQQNGDTLLTIPLGHALAAMRDVLGDIRNRSSLVSTRRLHVLVKSPGDSLPLEAPDQVLFDADLESGVRLSFHYRGGAARGTGFIWKIM